MKTHAQTNYIEEINAPKPETFPDYQGNPVKIKWPKGKVIARTGDVYLILQSKSTLAVVYGLEVIPNLNLDSSARQFGYCCIHQATCAGLMD